MNIAKITYVIARIMLAYQFFLFAEVYPCLAAGRETPELRRINFVSTRGGHRTPNPAGWEEFSVATYSQERGYGWITHAGAGWDGGGYGEMIMPDGQRASPRSLGRLELANWQGGHQENRLLVFRIDLPNGWYRVTCTSVDPDNAPLPLVDQRSIKFRAKDVVLAGSKYGPPLKIEGNRLIEGAGIVEVNEGHLRIVVGDPAYGGWTYSYPGPLWRGWKFWLKRWRWFGPNWYQKLTRSVDPGFHSLRLNSLVVERVDPPAKNSTLIFRDLFHRDDSADVNSGLADRDRWIKRKIDPGLPDNIDSELYRTSLQLTASEDMKGVVGMLQQRLSPKKGTIRYSTSVSVFTGEGSQIGSGFQEAGLLLLSEPSEPSEFNSTFIGVVFDQRRSGAPGSVRYRVGNRQGGYRTNTEIPDADLPFRVTEGGYEIIVDHDVKANILRRIQINGADITPFFTPASRQQEYARGLFGIRASMDPLDSSVALKQFYWHYQVEDVAKSRP